MRLYVVRHGIAVNRTDPQCPPEAERYLTAEGIRKTQGVAQGLKALGLAPSHLVSSPYVRAVQTAEIIAEALGFDRARIRRSDALKPEGQPGQFFEELKRMRGTEVICFGHAPQLDDLIALALGSNRPVTALKKAGVACLELKTVAPGQARIEWLFPPKALRWLAD